MDCRKKFDFSDNNGEHRCRRNMGMCLKGEMHKFATDKNKSSLIWRQKLYLMFTESLKIR